jgi:hypothetical protein
MPGQVQKYPFEVRWKRRQLAKRQAVPDQRGSEFLGELRARIRVNQVPCRPGRCRVIDS